MTVCRFALVFTLSSLLTGCINSGTLVRVKPDGSGTIEQTILVNMQALKGLMAGIGGAGKETSSGGVLNEAEFKRTAERMGVKPVSLTPLKEGGFEGAKAIFAFDDISKIKVDQDPQMSGSSSGKVADKPSSNNPIQFSFARQGPVSVLSITVDDKAVKDVGAKVAEKSDGPPMDPAMMQMIKGMFQGFKVAIDLEVDGTIVKTNADYVSGSRITLLAVDAEGLFADEAKLKALQSKIGPDASIAELRPYLKDIKGVKINNPSISVTFR